MNLELFREYCLNKKGVTEELPFGPDTLVFKVMGKLFALCGLDDVPGSCNLKCDPVRAEELRERFSSIIPGYHMNKKHWNTIEWDGNVADELILELIDHSYDLVGEGLPLNLRREIKKEPAKKNLKQVSKEKKKKLTRKKR